MVHSFISPVRRQAPDLSVGGERGAQFSLPPALTLLSGLQEERVVTVSKRVLHPLQPREGRTSQTYSPPRNLQTLQGKAEGGSDGHELAGPLGRQKKKEEI